MEQLNIAAGLRWGRIVFCYAGAVNIAMSLCFHEAMSVPSVLFTAGLLGLFGGVLAAALAGRDQRPHSRRRVVAAVCGAFEALAIFSLMELVEGGWGWAFWLTAALVIGPVLGYYKDCLPWPRDTDEQPEPEPTTPPWHPDNL